MTVRPDVASLQLLPHKVRKRFYLPLSLRVDVLTMNARRVCVGQAAAQCLDTRPVEERFSLGQFGQHHDPSGSIAGLEDGDDASSVHSEGLGTAKQVLS